MTAGMAANFLLLRTHSFLGVTKLFYLQFLEICQVTVSRRSFVGQHKPSLRAFSATGLCWALSLPPGSLSPGERPRCQVLQRMLVSSHQGRP